MEAQGAAGYIARTCATISEARLQNAEDGAREGEAVPRSQITIQIRQAFMTDDQPPATSTGDAWAVAQPVPWL